MEFREIRIFENETGFDFIDNSSKEKMFTMSKAEFRSKELSEGSVKKYVWNGVPVLTVCLEIKYLEVS